MTGSLLNQTQAAKELGVDRKTLRRWTARGIVPVFRDPDTDRPLYPTEALSEWQRSFADNVKKAS